MPPIAKVAPYAGAWIEIYDHNHNGVQTKVAPYAGAWIEMISILGLCLSNSVAPYAGAWIEITWTTYNRKKSQSHPTRVRGLK